jgi:ATP-dependent Lon protease
MDNYQNIKNVNVGNPNSQNNILLEVKGLENKIAQANLPIGLRENAMKAIQRLQRSARLGTYSNEFSTVEKYIDWVTRIPFGKVTEDNLDLQNAKRIMDQTHYGMDTIKNLILDYLSIMQVQKSRRVQSKERGQSANAPVMLFLGLQGVGKTSIARSIAEAMGRKFVRVSLGAIGDVRTLRGANKSSLDAEPGQIVKSLISTGTMNPVILLDELDKASGNAGLLNDVMAALLEILDPEQNVNFTDHYIDYPIDISNVFFICTANNLGGISTALLDRMEVIRFTSYTDEEKTVIAKQYLLPRVLKNIGINEKYITVDEEVWPILVRPVGFDAGLRQLERNIATMVRSATRKIVEGTQIPINITAENIKQFVLPDQGPLS